MYTKLVLKLKTKYMYLSNEELINHVLSNNILISNFAKEELLKRDLTNLELSDEIINQLLNKFTIEDLWYLANTKINNHFIEVVTDKLNQILDYY